LSKIIRQFAKAPTVYIGERHEVTRLEEEAEQTLKQFFPAVSFITSSDGARFIPIQEVLKLKVDMEEQASRARQEGYDEGYQKGMQDGQAEARRVVADLERAIRETVGQREALLEEARRNVLDLAVKIARKVTFDAVEADPDLTAKMISAVIDSLIDRSRLIIKVNPDFLPVMEQHMNRFLESSTSIKDLKFEADPRVRHGGCFIETPSGDIDARLESQFEVVEEAILNDESGS
jgi:flagellar assembly protein FliH